MKIVLNAQELASIDDITSLMLYGYASFTSFIFDEVGIKGWKKHLERLENDATFLFDKKINIDDIVKNINMFLKINNLSKSIMRITIFPDNFLLSSPNNIDKLNIMITGKEYTENTISNKSLSLFSYNEKRVFPTHKTVNLTVNIKARVDAKNNNFDDALLVDDTKVLETSTANIFFYKNEVLYTPKSNILFGTTRNLILEYTKLNNIICCERDILITEIDNFDGCFITNAVIGAQSVSKINNVEFGINEAFVQKIQTIYNSIPVDYMQ